MSTELDNTATNIDAICSKINTDLSAIASIETELAKNTATSLIATTNALLGKSAATEKAVVATAKPKVRRKKRKSKIKPAAIATSAIEKAAADTADASVAA